MSSVLWTPAICNSHDRTIIKRQQQVPQTTTEKLCIYSTTTKTKALSRCCGYLCVFVEQNGQVNVKPPSIHTIARDSARLVAVTLNSEDGGRKRGDDWKCSVALATER